MVEMKSRNANRLLILTILSFFILIPVQAREHYVFSLIDSNDGLSENRVRSISQLSDGRMVIVTNGLVNLYDGTSFHYIHYDDEKVYHLSEYFGFYHLYVDTQERLWVKDYQKLMLFDLKKESFVHNLDSVLLEEGITASLSNFFMDSKSNLWCLTNQNELILKEPNQKDVTVFISDFSQLTKNNDELYDLSIYENQVFLFFKSGTMVCFNLNTRKELYRENPFEKEDTGLYERTLMVIPHKQFLYQIRNGETGILLRYDIENRKWKTILKQNYTFNTLSVDNNGNLWISSPQGLWFISHDLQDMLHIPELQLVDGRVFLSEIDTQFHDNQGGLWIGTSDRGLLYYHPDRFKFRNIGRTFFGINNKQKLKVTCFAELNEEIVVGTSSNGVYRYSHQNNFPLIPFAEIPQNTQCNWMLKDSKQRIWLCTENNGLYCITKTQTKHYTLPFNSAYFIHETPQGLLYLCTDAGLGIFDPQTESYKQMETTKRSAVGCVFQLVPYEQNSFLLLSDIGLSIYDYKNDLLQVPEKDKNRKQAIFRQSNQRYNCLFADSRGLIWFGTEDGLNVWNNRENRLRSFHTENGLVNNYIQSIIEDNQNRIWVSTSCGISCIDVEKENESYQYSFSNFNSYDGIISNEFLKRSVCLTSSGTLLWGGVDGFNELNLSRVNKLQQNTLPPLFVKFFLFGVEIKQGNKYNGEILLNQSIASTKELKLHYNQNFIAFEFSALNYINPARTFYRYYLEGIDESWHEIAAENGMGRANYTNLPPGDYLLKVCASNSNLQWDSECVEMRIVIAPPFWKTPLAYFFYMLSFLVLFYFLFAYYLKKSKEKLVIQQKEHLNRMKFQFFTNISHELRTPLTLVITPLEAMIKKITDEKQKIQLSEISRNANTLLNMVNQLLDFRRIEMSGETLHLSYCDINDFVDSICSSFKLLSQSKNIEFTWECNLSNSYTYVDKDKLQKIINNLLSNAAKFTPEEGTIHLLLENRILPDNQTEMFCIQVTDNGCGIPEKEIPKIFDRFYQVENKQTIQNTGSGIGLHITQEYVQLHHGHIQAESIEGKGSTFAVYIPLHLKPAAQVETEIKQQENILQVLIVEDNNEFRAFLSNQLSEQYTVICASNGKIGLEKAIEFSPDLIVSDVMMPEMDGIEMCRNLKKDVRVSHIPVILLTARSSEDAQIEGYDAGVDAYISKPFSMEILLLRIHNFAEQQKQRKALFKNAIVIQPESITTTSLDEELIKKAIKCIENNLSNSLYSVEQFSKDLNMDRTGLYRKLSAIVGQAPSVFIRSVRLKRAAQMLEQGIAVSEVSDLVGFGTRSHFSKCFQEEFGVKPSQYRNPQTNTGRRPEIS